MKYGVWAVPPKKGPFSDLLPRFQTKYGKTAEWDDLKAVEEWVYQCNADGNGWTYSVRELHSEQSRDAEDSLKEMRA